MRILRNRRVQDIEMLLRTSAPERLSEFRQTVSDPQSAEPSVIEEWFAIGKTRWMESHGGFEPPCRTRPLC